MAGSNISEEVSGHSMADIRKRRDNARHARYIIPEEPQPCHGHFVVIQLRRPRSRCARRDHLRRRNRRSRPNRKSRRIPQRRPDTTIRGATDRQQNRNGGDRQATIPRTALLVFVEPGAFLGTDPGNFLSRGLRVAYRETGLNGPPNRRGVISPAPAHHGRDSGGELELRRSAGTGRPGSGVDYDWPDRSDCQRYQPDPRSHE